MILVIILGIITGLLIAIIIFCVVCYFRIPTIRKINQIESKMKQKGKIIELDNEQLQTFIENLPNENEM